MRYSSWIAGLIFSIEFEVELTAVWTATRGLVGWNREWSGPNRWSLKDVKQEYWSTSYVTG